MRAQSGEVALQVDALEAQDAQVQAAIDTLETNVATQAAELDEAERALAAAEAEVATAEANVVVAQARIDALNQQTDDLVVEAFVNPASDNALDGFRADTLSDMMVKQALVDIQSDADADVLDQLEQAHEDLAVEQANKEARRRGRRGEARRGRSRPDEVQNALAQQEAFAAEVEERLNAKLAEAESLRTFDAAARRPARARAGRGRRPSARRPGGGRRARPQPRRPRPPPRRPRPAVQSGGGGGGGGGRRRRWRWRWRWWWRWWWRRTGAVGDRPRPRRPGHRDLPLRRVDQGGRASIAGNVQALLDAAAAQGVSLCASSGWRSPDKQVELRRAALRHLVLRDLPDALVAV